MCKICKVASESHLGTTRFVPCPGTEQNNWVECENSLSHQGKLLYSPVGCEKWSRTHCARALAQQGFSQTILQLLSVILCLSSLQPHHLFTASPAWRGHPFKWLYLSCSPFSAFFVGAHCVRFLAWCVYLCSLPPTRFRSLPVSLSVSHIHNYSSGLKQRW